MTSKTRCRRRSLRGNAMVQALVASAILATTLAGVTSMWYVSYNLTVKADNTGVAYTIARRQLETIKQNCYQSGGYQLSTDSTSTNYFDEQGNDTTSSNSNHIFTVVTVLATNNGLQTANISVTGPGSSNTLYQSSTYLVKAGI